MLKSLSILLIVSSFVLAGCAGGGENATSTQSPVSTSSDSVIVEVSTVQPTLEATAQATAEMTNEAVIVTDSASTDEPAVSTDSITNAATAEAGAVTSENTAASGVTAMVSFPSTYARSGPATTFAQLQTVTVNQTFNVIAKTGEGTAIWYLVDLGEGQLGWLWSRVVTINPENADVEVAATVPAP